MFTEDPRCIKIADRIFKFENIIPEDIYNAIIERTKTFEKGKQFNAFSMRDWYEDRMSPPMLEVLPLWEFMSELIYPELVAHPVMTLMVTDNTDEGMFIHTDSPGKGNCDRLVEIDTWQTCCELEYGMIAYLGEYTGGELYYPNINPDGSVKPDLNPTSQEMYERVWQERLQEPCLVVETKPGDIVFHGAAYPYDHGTKPTLTGTRYAFSNFILLTEDNPGTFYSYKTPEYIEQLGDKSVEKVFKWAQPLMINPQFKEVIDEALMRTRLHEKGEDTNIPTPSTDAMRKKITN